MCKLLVRLMFGVGTLSLFVSALGITHMAVFAEDRHTPTPTAKPFDYPGVDLLLPSAGTFSEEAVSAFGYEIRADNFAQENGNQRIDVRIAGHNHKPDQRITASLLLSNSQILESYVRLEKVRPYLDLTELDWQLLNPKAIFMSYGTPSIARANLSTTDSGLRGVILAVWENHNLAVMYGIRLKDDDRDSMSNPLKFNICLSPDRVFGFTAWLSSEERNILEAMRYPYDYDHAFIFGQPFSPTMFTNAPDLATFAQRLANGECLETRREVWFGSQ